MKPNMQQTKKGPRASSLYSMRMVDLYQKRKVPMSILNLQHAHGRSVSKKKGPRASPLYSTHMIDLYPKEKGPMSILTLQNAHGRSVSKGRKELTHEAWRHR